jgi:hypothetical protein
LVNLDLHSISVNHVAGGNNIDVRAPFFFKLNFDYL